MSKKLLILIVAGALVLGGGGFFAMKLLGGGDARAAGAAAEEEPPAGLLPMETFLANVADRSGERFARLELKLAVVPKEKVDEIENDPLLMARMRDRVLTLLTSKTFEELSDPMGKEGFRSEIRMRLSPLVEDGEIKEVLFSEFVVQ